MASATPSPIRIWGLLGHRRGDNRQVVTLGAALGGAFAEKRLRYSKRTMVPNYVRRARPVGIVADPETPIAPPWPDLVIAVGRRSVPLALAIRRASQGRTRLVQLGRPGAPLSWFDLVVTTPQYQLPAAPNVITIPLPFSGFSAAAEPPVNGPNAAPVRVVLVGGPTAEIRLDVDEAEVIARRSLTAAAACGERLVIVTSPRTPAAVGERLAALAPAPHTVHVWREGGENPYAEVLAAATRIVVTADSVSMLADAFRTRAVVEVFPLPPQDETHYRIATFAHRHLRSRANGDDSIARICRIPFTSGILPAPRLYSAVHTELARRHFLGPDAFTPDERWRAMTRWEQEVVARVQALLQSPQRERQACRRPDEERLLP